MTVTEFGAVYSEGVNHFYVVGEPVVMVIDTERYLSAPSAYSAGITWESDNEEIAVVSDDGKISAVGEGHATITARNEDGIIVTFDITVESRSDTEASDRLRDASDVNSKVSDENPEISFKSSELTDENQEVSCEKSDEADIGSEKSDIDTKTSKLEKDTYVNNKEPSGSKHAASISEASDHAPSTGSSDDLFLLFIVLAVSLFTGYICIINSKQKRSVSK